MIPPRLSARSLIPHGHTHLRNDPAQIDPKAAAPNSVKDSPGRNIQKVGRLVNPLEPAVDEGTIKRGMRRAYDGHAPLIVTCSIHPAGLRPRIVSQKNNSANQGLQKFYGAQGSGTATLKSLDFDILTVGVDDSELAWHPFTEVSSKIPCLGNKHPKASPRINIGGVHAKAPHTNLVSVQIALGSKKRSLSLRKIREFLTCAPSAHDEPEQGSESLHSAT